MTKTLDEIRRLFAEGTLAGLSDGQLLERFAARGDGDAFAAIVARHGATVLAACRSSLGPRDAALAEDAFQATFLVLVRRAGSFPVHDSLAGWLYRVARRVGAPGPGRGDAAEGAGAGRGRPSRGRPPARPRPRRDPPPGPPGAGPTARAVSDADPALRPPRPDPRPGGRGHRLPARHGRGAAGPGPGAAPRTPLPPGVDSPAAWPTAVAASAVDVSQLSRRTTEAAVLAARGGLVATTAAALLAARASRGLLAARAPDVPDRPGGGGSATAVLGPRADRGPRDDPPQAPPAAAAPAPRPRAEPGPPVDPDDPATADLFAGKVVDADGRPLGGAKVYIVAPGHAAPEPGADGPGGRPCRHRGGRPVPVLGEGHDVPSLDGLPARRPGLLIAAAEGHGPDWMPTWGQTGSSFVSHWDPVKGAD